MLSIEIYTDGACSGNPGPGGWGAYLIYGSHEKKISGFSLYTTNNRMELIAAIEALKLLNMKCKVNLYTDSQYLKNGITKWITQWIKNNWLTSNKKLVSNVDLWQDLYIVMQSHEVCWHWVKGHSTNIGNCIADKLAVAGKQEALRLVQYGSS